MDELSGLVALVSGGAGGIGLATATKLADAGARVATFDVAERPEDPRLLHLLGDVRDSDSLEGVIAAVLAEFGVLDILINNAGVGAVGTVEDGDLEQWARVHDVNVLGIVRTTRLALPHLRKSASASIVNVSSIVARMGLPERACYAATKGAVLSLTLAMAADLISENIRVNCVLPGTVDTDWVSRLLRDNPDPDDARRSLAARQPLGRLATPDEVAHALAYLVSPQASFVTGSAVAVDGGLSGLQLPAARQNRDAAMSAPLHGDVNP